MEVVEYVPVQNGDRHVTVTCSELEVKMLLTFAINELINRGSISLLSQEDRDKLASMEQLLEADVQGSA
jgi:hypothetical protein